MVRTEKVNPRHYYDFYCEVCNKKFNNKKEAEECESTTPSRIDIDTKNYYYDGWRIGDIFMMVAYDECTDIELVEIVDESTEGHELIPIIKDINGNLRRYNDAEYLVLSNDSLAELARWSDKITKLAIAKGI